MSGIIKVATAFYAIIAIICGTLLWQIGDVNPVSAYCYSIGFFILVGVAEFFLARWYFISRNKTKFNDDFDYDGGYPPDDGYHPVEEFHLNSKVDPFDNNCCGGNCSKNGEEFYDENIDAPDGPGK